MMKRNFFGKVMVITMMFAGLSLTSCDENDNAIINGEVWIKPEVKLVDGGAVVTASTISDLNRMIGRLREEISKSAQAGETFSINIETPTLDATESEHTIIIPTLKDADIVVNFTNSISTDVPLLIESMGAGNNATPVISTNEVEINFASGTSGIDLELNMPTSTVTLKGATFNELIANTALNTLIIESGVTVDWLLVKGGFVVVKEGGKVNGFLGNSSSNLYVYGKGIVGHMFKNELPKGEQIEEDEFYYVEKGRIIKSEDGGSGFVRIVSLEEESDTEVDITICDGAKAYVDCILGEFYPGVNIIGEGNAKIINNGYKDKEGKVHPNNVTYRLYAVRKLSNVTVDATAVLLRNDETKKYEEVELEEGAVDIDLNLPQNAENCEFITIDRIDYLDPIWYNSGCLNHNIVSSTFKDCKITFKSEEAGGFLVKWPLQNDDRASFKLIFDTCELNNILFDTYFRGDYEDYNDFKAYIILDNSKMNGKAITKDTEMIEYVEENSTTSTFFTIDGKTYLPKFEADVWSLVEPE